MACDWCGRVSTESANYLCTFKSPEGSVLEDDVCSECMMDFMEMTMSFAKIVEQDQVHTSETCKNNQELWDPGFALPVENPMYGKVKNQ